MTRSATRVGEGFAGDGAHVAHVTTVLGERGGPFEGAWTAALASPRPGHAPFLVVVQPGLALQPPTLFVNKATIADQRHAHLTWGAAQAGVARGVMDALSGGVIDPSAVGELLLLVSAWVDPAADDADLVYRHNRSATFDALRLAAAGEPTVADLLVAGPPWNPFYDAR